MLQSLNIDKPESYLGKNIDTIREKFSLKESPISLFDSHKSFECEPFQTQIYFLNRECRRLSTSINEQDTILSIFIATKKKIDNAVFLILKEQYGHPTSMQKMGTIEKVEHSEGDGYTATSTVGEAVNCTFEENPIFIIWEKPDYIIHIEMDSIRDNSLITFKMRQ